jgi:hypothetical protein
MMRWIKALGGLLLASALVACGGGGGNPGTPATSTNAGSSTSGGTGSSTTTANTPTMVLSVVNSSGTAVAGNSVTSGTTAFVKAQVKDSKGAAVPNKLVTFTSGTKTVGFQPSSGQVLTDSTGVASVQVMPASVSSAGADTVTAATNVDNQAITGTIDVQTSAANVTLGSMSAAQAALEE